MSFSITIIEALLKRDVGTVANMDPYVKLKLGKNELKTSVHYGAGKKPRWDDKITLPQAPEKLLLEVYDKGKISDTLVASTNIDISQYIDVQQPKEQTIQIYFDNANAGKLKWKVEYIAPKNKSGIQTKISADSQLLTAENVTVEASQVNSQFAVEQSQYKQGYSQQGYQGQPYQGQPYQGQPYQGQPYQGQPFQGQPYQQYPNQYQQYPNQFPNQYLQQYPNQQYPNQQYSQGQGIQQEGQNPYYVSQGNTSSQQQQNQKKQQKPGSFGFDFLDSAAQQFNKNVGQKVGFKVQAKPGSETSDGSLVSKFGQFKKGFGF